MAGRNRHELKRAMTERRHMIGDATVSSAICTMAPAKKMAIDGRRRDPNNRPTDTPTVPIVAQNNGQCVM